MLLIFQFNPLLKESVLGIQALRNDSHLFFRRGPIKFYFDDAIFIAEKVLIQNAFTPMKLIRLFGKPWGCIDFLIVVDEEEAFFIGCVAPLMQEGFFS
jgi:hypothetical protein